MSLIADPGAVSLSPVFSNTFVEIDHQIFSPVILLLPLIQEGLLSITSEEHSILVNHSSLSWPRESVVNYRLTDQFDMTIAVDCKVKLQTIQTKTIFSLKNCTYYLDLWLMVYTYLE